MGIMHVSSIIHSVFQRICITKEAEMIGEHAIIRIHNIVVDSR